MMVVCNANVIIIKYDIKRSGLPNAPVVMEHDKNRTEEPTATDLKPEHLNIQHYPYTHILFTYDGRKSCPHSLRQWLSSTAKLTMRTFLANTSNPCFQTHIFSGVVYIRVNLHQLIQGERWVIISTIIISFSMMVLCRAGVICYYSSTTKEDQGFLMQQQYRVIVL